MEVNKECTIPKKCFKPSQPLYGKLQVAVNSSNTNTVLWNKYQIFVYENLNFQSALKVLIPNYQIYCILITDNYLLCVDTNGYSHLTAMKFKNSAQKQIQCLYQPKDQGIKACVPFIQDHSLNLKFVDKYCISVNKISPEYNEVKNIELDSEYWGLQETVKEQCLLAHTKIQEGFAKLFKKMYSIENLSDNCHFIVMSFDKFTLYGCLYDPKMTEVQTKLIKLYSCPSEICNIKIIGSDFTYLLIALCMGSVVRLKLEEMFHNNNPVKPQVAHMNSAIHKFELINDNNSFVYTDGYKMWKADNVFSDQMSFSQFHVKNVNDFSQCGDTFICTTYNELIYTIPYKDENSWHKQKEGYSSAEVVLNDSECMNQIFKEVERGKDLSNKLKVEGAYLAAMSLCRRPDIMDKVVLTELNIYDRFEDVMKRNEEDLTLTEEISAYFEPDTYLLLLTVKINVKVHISLYEVITNILTNSQAEVHVTLSNEYKTLKTTSIKISKATCLIPVQLGQSSEINVNIRLVPVIPGTYDRKQSIWTELYTKNIKLTAENFIKGNPKRCFINLKRSKEELHKSILTLTSSLYGQQFHFMDMDKESDLHSMYVRLPRTNIADNFTNYINYTKSEFMIKSLSSDDFLTSKSKMCFKVGKETVEISLENDGFSKPQLRVSSRNVKTTTHIRNLFADIVYGENECKSGEEFISNSFYTTVENLQTEVKDCVSTGNFKRFKPLMEQFDKDIIGVLPI